MPHRNSIHQKTDDASMQLSRLFLLTALLFAPLAVFGTTWLYLYPVFHGCTFPVPHKQSPGSHASSGSGPHSSQAPFRLLALGDPQLEGDSSLPDPNAPLFPSLEYFATDITFAKTWRARLDVLDRAKGGITRDALKWLEGKRKAVDLWGNDRYLAHIVRQTRWWSEPTHVAVLGDLLGSQWVTRGEFEKRARRYWGVVMRGLERVEGRVFGGAWEGYGDEMVEEGHGETKEKEDGGEDEVENPENEQTEAREGRYEEEEEVEAEDAVVEVDVHNGGVESERTVEDKALRRELTDAIGEGTHGDAIGEDVTVEERNEHTQDEPAQDEHAQNDHAEDGHTRDEESDEQAQKEEKPLRTPAWGGTTEVLGADKNWARRVINIAGNHDVGYAGDIDFSRIERFERAFGSVNWDIWFTLPSETNEETPSEISPPALRIVVLNSMNIDTPAWSSELQTETYQFMNHIITSSRPVEDKSHATILLTHIPLEKQPGICVDSPYFNFFDEGQGVREQNMLSDYSSKTILEGVFGMSDNRWAAGGGMGRRGIVINGHDHAGCDVTHFIRQEGADDECAVNTVAHTDAHWPTPTPKPAPMSHPIPLETSPANMLTAHTQTSPAPLPAPAPEYIPPGWRAHRFPTRPFSITHNPLTNTSSCTRIDGAPHIREITLRSMMGDFSGHAGFLSGWYDREHGEWVFEFNSCAAGVQHWWWGVHSLDFGVLAMLGLAGVSWGVERVRARGKGKGVMVNGNTK
jgi:hypothetical protein